MNTFSTVAHAVTEDELVNIRLSMHSIWVMCRRHIHLHFHSHDGTEVLKKSSSAKNAYSTTFYALSLF